MTLKEQFPDVSMLMREKHKLKSKFNASTLFRDIHYTPTILDQKFYDSEFRKWHFKLVVFVSILVVLLVAVLVVVLSG